MKLGVYAYQLGGVRVSFRGCMANSVLKLRILKVTEPIVEGVKVKPRILAEKDI